MVNLTKTILLACAVAAAGACTDGETIGGGGTGDDAGNGGNGGTPEIPTAPEDTSGGEDNTFNHPGGPDIWDYLERLAEEGPTSFTSRMHSCPKMTYAKIGNILRSRGVDLSAAGGLSAGFLWRNGAPALGAPKLAVRSRENAELTTAAAAKLFDIFAMAAPEMIAAMPTLPACMIGGVGTEMFDANGKCTLDGIACLTGVPATLSHLELCNEMISRATTTSKGQQIAVAALTAAAHTCE